MHQNHCFAPLPPPYRRPLGQDWLDQVFRSRAVQDGGINRRGVADVHREIGLPLVELDVGRRGFRLLRTASHDVVICATGPIDIICQGVSRLSGSLPRCGEDVLTFLVGEQIADVADGLPELIAGSGGGASDQSFELRKSQLDGSQIGAVWRGEAKPRTRISQVFFAAFGLL